VAVGASTDRSILNENSPNSTTKLGYANYDSKRQGEEIVLKAARDGKLNATVVNPSLMYGERDAKKAMRKGNVRAAQGKLPFYTSGGVNIVAVEDVVHAMINAVSKGRSGERYLLTGENVTIQDLLTTISDMAGAKAPQKLLSDKLLWNLAKVHDFLGLKTELCQENCFAATAFHWYDNSKAKKELEFQPGPWKEAVLRSVQWMKDNGLVRKP
jgi:dihydroflavonol-4-reductase